MLGPAWHPSVLLASLLWLLCGPHKNRAHPARLSPPSRQRPRKQGNSAPLEHLTPPPPHPLLGGLPRGGAVGRAVWT